MPWVTFAKFGGLPNARAIEVGGMPALYVDVSRRVPDGVAIDVGRVARRFVMQADVDADGRITRMYSVLASRKLTHVPNQAA